MTHNPNSPTPTSLGGYQSICSVEIQAGDLLIPKLAQGAHEWVWAKGHIGGLVTFDGYTQSGNFRVYRKIPVAHHLDRCPMTHELAPTIAPAPALAEVIPFPVRAKAATYDAGKPALAHVPSEALYAISRAQAYGHKKYGDFNNFRKGMEITRSLSCVLRHVTEYLDGSNSDHESGLNPLDHAITRLAFVLQNLKDGTAIDDRFKAVAK